MRILLACSLAAASAFSATPARAEHSSTLTVVVRAGAETKYAEVAKVLQALGKAKVADVEVESQSGSDISAVILGRGDTPYRDVINAREALRSAGVRNVTFATKR